MKAYSTGMGSRLRFAIASAKSHDILLVDEALATGDAEFQRKSHDRIDELRAQAGTVFLVAHQLSEIYETCNRVIWIEKGQIVKAGRRRPRHPRRLPGGVRPRPAVPRPGHRGTAAPD